MENIINKIIEIAKRVQMALGTHQPEKFMGRLLFHYIERDLGLTVIQEKEIPITYDGIELGSRRIDAYIETEFGPLILELKHLQNNPTEFSQLNYYMQMTNTRHGLLIKFFKEPGFPIKNEWISPEVLERMYFKRLVLGD